MTIYDKIKDEDWLKTKGYLHFTPPIDVIKNRNYIVSQITNSDFITNYAFMPLLHKVMRDRKYKKSSVEGPRAHSYFDQEKDDFISTTKPRPLHYACQMDALIMAYYAQKLNIYYNKKLKKDHLLDEAIIAYRKQPTAENPLKNKSTIHFANECFTEIARRTKLDKECIVLAYDLKSFFSTLDHAQLKCIWAEMLGETNLPPNHYNVFKACTKFSYIYYDDLRKSNFLDEQRLAQIRNKFGISAIFENKMEFHNAIKTRKLKICNTPFRDKETKVPVGIPQGLPISATLANLYLYPFDLNIVELVVKQLGGYYRRYSDDILIICKDEDREKINHLILTAIKDRHVKISEEKTEIFKFRLNKNAIECLILKDGEFKKGIPLRYLGFEYDGLHKLIKSASLSKFYRKMIYSVKRKSKRAIKIALINGEDKPTLFLNQIYKLYAYKKGAKYKVKTHYTKIIKNQYGEHRLISKPKQKPLQGSYFTYVQKAATIMNEPTISHQINKHKSILHKAINRHLTQRWNMYKDR